MYFVHMLKLKYINKLPTDLNMNLAIISKYSCKLTLKTVYLPIRTHISQNPSRNFFDLVY